MGVQGRARHPYGRSTDANEAGACGAPAASATRTLRLRDEAVFAAIEGDLHRVIDGAAHPGTVGKWLRARQGAGQ
jgi:hypothetical protein